jgi:hypothetical protein
MTSSTYASSVIVLGDKDTGDRVEMLATNAAEHGVGIAATHTYEAGQPSSHNDLGEIDAVVAALSQAIRTRTNIWLPFLVDLLPEQHVRRLSLVLQRHGLNLLIGRELWPCPSDGGINEVDIALRREVRAVDELDRAAMAAAGVQTLTDEIEAELQESGLSAPHTQQWSDFLQQLEVQYGPHPGLPATRGAWRDRKPGLERFAVWLVHRCGMTRGEAAQFLNAFGHRTQTGRNWQRPTVSALVNGRYDRRPTAA